MLATTTKTNALNKNILLSVAIKAFNILFVILIVRRSLEVLGVEDYGIWMAITSISTWITLLDIGIGNGLRVELRRCFLNEEWKEARTLLNTAYIFIGRLSMVIVVVFFIIWTQTDWATVFNIKNYSVQNVNLLILITFIGLILQLICSLLQPVLNANLHSGLANIFSAIANGFILCYLYLVNEHTINILQYGFLNAFLPVIVYIGFSIFYYKKYVPQVTPNFKERDFKKIKPILLVSGKFFLLQISAVISYQMTSFLLIRYFTPNEVAEYNIAYRYFNLINIAFMTVLSPLWSLSTDAYLRGDVAWIIKMIKKYLVMFMGVFAALIVAFFLRDFVFKIWLNGVYVSPKIAFYVALYIGIYCWNCIFLYVVTGAGKLNAQFILAIVTMIIFFPMTHFLVRVMNWGIDGVFISNMIILLMSSILIPIQTYYVLKTNRKSYWLN